jgi:hypothetical protein
MSVIRTRKRSTPYVTLHTNALNDARLSFRAKGLHTYLMSKPDDWKVYIEQLEKASPREGRDAIRSALKELADAGYITRTRLQDTRGRMMGWDTTVYETPELAHEEAHSTENGFADVGSTEVGSTDIGLSEVGLSEVGSTEVGSTENGLADVGSTEVGSTDVGLSAATYSGSNKDLIKPNLELTHPPSPHGGAGEVRAYTHFEAQYSAHTPISHEVQEVLTYLNGVTKRHYNTPGRIADLLRQGITPAQCCLVIDWYAAVHCVTNPEVGPKNFNNDTPFKPELFDKYRAAAEQWDSTGRPDPQAETRTGKVSAKGLRNLASTRRLLKKEGLV